MYGSAKAKRPTEGGRKQIQEPLISLETMQLIYKGEVLKLKIVGVIADNNSPHRLG